jgi:hypothetical protein
LILKHFSIVHPPNNSFSASKRNKTVTKPNSLYPHRSKTLRLVGLLVDLLEGLALHLKLHLRVLLEDLGVALPQPLRDPFIGNAAGTEPRRLGGTQIVDAEIGYLGAP